jgi:hypothetical protein
MIENLPSFISIIFILTTFLTIGFLFYAIKQTIIDSTHARIVIFLIGFSIFLQAILALGGFYQNTSTVPPRLFLFAVLPALLLIISLFVFARKSFIEPLPLKILTILHIIRIPVELILHQLYENKLIPQIMTYEGWNFDILSGITAPFMFWLAFRGGKPNRPLLIVWNIFALLLLVNIVAIAILSVASPVQRFGFDQPNRAILYFPFIWLAAIVVPIVLFSHLASLWKLLKSEN